MSTKPTLALSVIATALAFVIAPALMQMQSASAVPAPKTDPGCDDPKFPDRTSCPGKSEDAAGDPRDDDCTPRNRGHIDDCEALVDEEDVNDPVNPPPK